MKTLRNLIVPTGNIVIAQGEKGLLEFMSIGDYGQLHNLKCDALGLGRRIKGPVKHVEIRAHVRRVRTADEQSTRSGFSPSFFI